MTPVIRVEKKTKANNNQNTLLASWETCSRISSLNQNSSIVPKPRRRTALRYYLRYFAHLPTELALFLYNSETRWDIDNSI